MDDLNGKALPLTHSLHKSLNTTQTWIQHQHGYLQIQLFDEGTCLRRAQSRDSAIAGLMKPLTEPPNEAQVVIHDQGDRPT